MLERIEAILMKELLWSQHMEGMACDIVTVGVGLAPQG
jgi:hypothetical protein